MLLKFVLPKTTVWLTSYQSLRSLAYRCHRRYEIVVGYHYLRVTVSQDATLEQHLNLDLQINFDGQSLDYPVFISITSSLN